MTETQDGRERRRYRRYAYRTVTNMMVAYRAGGPIMFGECERVTGDGLAVAVTEPLASGTELEARFGLPGTWTTIVAVGKVEASMPHSQGDGRSVMIVRFSDLRPSEAEALAKYAAASSREMDAVGAPSPDEEPAAAPAEGAEPPAAPGGASVWAIIDPQGLAEAVIETDTTSVEPPTQEAPTEVDGPASELRSSVRGLEATLQYSSFSSLTEALVKNISRGGVMIATDHPVELDTRIQVHLVPPGLVEGMWFTGKVVWVKEGEGVGVEFDNLTSERIAALGAIVEEAAKTTGEID